MTTAASSPLDRRREAVRGLGAALRSAIVALCASEVPADRLAEATELADRVTDILSTSQRQLSEIASTDVLATSTRFFSPVTGVGNPMSPPLTFSTTGVGVESRITLDRRFEGPAGFVHGGVISLLLDEVLGQANTAAGGWGMTAFLNVTFRRALPLDVELVLTSHIVSVDGRKVSVEGGIALASNPTVLHVEAQALFIEPRPETQQQYFGSLTSLDGTPTSARQGRDESAVA